MIGYNVEEINNLMKSVARTYENMAEYIGRVWPIFENKMQTEWIGPDEAAYQNEIANRLIQLHNQCRETISSLNTDLFNIGQAWKDFQTKNVVSGGQFTANVNAVATIESVTIADYNLNQLVKTDYNPTFAAGTKLGLTNGASSGANIKNAAKSFADSVHSYAKTIFSQLDASNAFLGGNQAVKINEYMTKIGDELGKFLTAFSDLYRAIDSLIVENYNTSESNVSSKVSSNMGNIQGTTQSVATE